MSIRNVMLTVAYQGTAYHGWQVQPNGLTVQQCIETAIEKLTGERTRLYCAGRTDSGVHAVGQVANFHTQSRISAHQFRRGIQRFLPDDITIVQSRDVHADFHSTFSAVRKTYRYLICDGDIMPPFYRDLVFRHKGSLNSNAMADGADALLGRHDFRCFETAYPNKATSVRTIEKASVSRIPIWNLWSAKHDWESLDARHHEDSTQPLICFEVTADGFLYNMVRAIVGTLLQIGRERKPTSHMADVIRSMDRSEAGNNVPPDGLYLMHVEYPAELLNPDNNLDNHAVSKHETHSDH